jgi:CrcB protein
MTYLLVALGSALGGVTRYWLTALIDTRASSAFPFGTLAVNVLGSFCIGLALALLPRDSVQSSAFLVAGVLGGFTTFSAFSAQTIQLLRVDAIVTAAIYVLASVLVCLIAAALGGWSARALG